MEQSPKEIRLGYCPTMESSVLKLGESYSTLIPHHYDHSAAAKQALQAGDVDAILIGRTAWQNERIGSLRLLRLVDGLTLVAQQPGSIRHEDLARITILTLESETAVHDLLPDGTNVIYYDDFDQMLVDFDHRVAVLLRWSQVSPTSNLLIPVDHAGNKTPDFRSPHFYYLESMGETLAPLLATLSTN